MSVRVQKLESELLLQNQIEALGLMLCFEKLMNNFGREMEGRVGENFVWLARQVVIYKILLYNLHILDTARGEILTKLLGSFVIWLDGNNFIATLRKRIGNHP